MSDLIDRQAAIHIASGYCHPANIAEELRKLPSAQPEQRWIPCGERLPEEDHWLGGSGKQFSDRVFVTVVNRDDEDIWTDLSHTIDGEWVLELPRHCEIVAWMPLPKPYREKGECDV